jgi:hypothetical protein
MKPLYELKYRQNGITTFLSIKVTRGDVTVTSAEKVIPPIILYDLDGNFEVIPAAKVIKGEHLDPKNIKADSEEKKADIYIDRLFKALEHFPTLGTNNHAVAELIYSNMVYLKPNKDATKFLNKLDFLKKMVELPKILEKLAVNFEKAKGIKLDLFSIPKRKVGTFCYIGGTDGISEVAKIFSFGFHNAIPCDRIIREISSFKAAEKFVNPITIPGLDIKYNQYITMLRVAIAKTEISMEDGGDLYPSAIPKLACNLERKKIVKDVSTVPIERRNLKYKPFRAGIEVVHEEVTIVNELETSPGVIRLVFPNGIKVAAQVQDTQATDMLGKEIDLLLDFRSIMAKGAVAIFAMKDQSNWSKNLTLDQCKEIFKNLEMDQFVINGKTFDGWIIDLPVIRPGQRYTELSKGSNRISVDLVAKAILKKPFKVKPKYEEEYRKLRNLRDCISRYIQDEQNKNVYHS